MSIDTRGRERLKRQNRRSSVSLQLHSTTLLIIRKPPHQHVERTSVTQAVQKYWAVHN